MLYFAYGSNLYGPRMRERCSTAHAMGPVCLKGHRLAWHKRSADGSGKCDVPTAQAESEVWGQLWKISEQDRQGLDVVEGVGRGYEPVAIQVHDAQGDEFEAFTYQATDIQQELLPYDWYKAYVLAGALQHGLPESQIALIESQAATPDTDTLRVSRNRLVEDAPTLQVIYRDEHYIGVHKPPGLLVHRSPIDRHEHLFLLQTLRDQIGQRVYPVHRLDKPTSGLIILGLSREAASLLGQQIQERGMVKEYQAVVRGWMDGEGVIDHAIRAKPDSYAKERRDNIAQDAVTRYRCMAQGEVPIAVGRYDSARYTLMELEPHTGRKHQLRHHMHHVSHPIIGDTTYGDGRQNRAFRERFGVHRLLLAATDLRFTHPYTKEEMHLNCPPEESFQRVCSLLFDDR